MPSAGDIWRRLLVGGRPAAERVEPRLPNRVALPVYSSTAVSSVAYATQELLVVLTLGGLSALFLTPWAAAGVVVVMVVVIAAYRRVVRVYPSGGADYEAAVRNLGEHAGLVTGGAMLIALVFTIAVAVAAAVDNLISAFPALSGSRTAIAVAVIVLLGLTNAGGLRSGGVLSAVPTYLFVVSIAILVVWGLALAATGDTPVAASAEFEVAAEGEVVGLALILLALRAVATGSVVLTGFSGIVQAAPAFRKPKRDNAATALLLAGVAAAILFIGITALAVIADVRYVADPCDLVGFDCAGQPQPTVVAQVAAAVFGDQTFGFFVVQLATIVVLLLAASITFEMFPMLGSVMAKYRHLPRQLHFRGDRHAFTNAVIGLAVAAITAVVVFQASVTRLVPPYVVSMLVAFALGQAGMVRHWNLQLSSPLRDDEKAKAIRSRIVSILAVVLAGAVAIVVGVAEFTTGVWVVPAAVAILYLVMRGIQAHYERVETELSVDGTTPGGVKLPSRIHAIVLVSRLHKPTMRALAYARSGRPDLLEAVTVNVDLATTRALTDEWDRLGIPVPLKVLDSPHGEINGPVLEYVNGIRRESPRDLVVVYIPEYVLGRWWEQLLHNKSALRLRSRLMFTPGVMVTMVPWQLDSSTQAGGKHPGREGRG